MTQAKYHRKDFLANSHAFISLPFLGSLKMGEASKTREKPSPVKRMVFLGTGFGFTRCAWYPDKKVVGKDYPLPKALTPLKKHKDSFTIIQNLYHKFSRDGHSGSTFWLTGANKFEVPGKNFHNTVSVDQVAAAKIGLKTRFASIQLSSNEPNKGGHGTGLSLSWDHSGKPLQSHTTPLEAYKSLFFNENISIKESQARLTEKKSILDTVLEDARFVKNRINHSDQQKLNEYFDSIRDIETRISKEESWLGVPRKRPSSLSEPSSQAIGKQEIIVNYDLMAAAMQVDASRIFTYRMPQDSFIESIGINKLAHPLSHMQHLPLEKAALPIERDLAHATLLAKFFDKLKNTEDSNGQSLFDSSVITFGSNLNSMHDLINCPTLVAGGAANIKLGQHFVMKNTKTPLCNFWLTLLQQVGINADAFGDSTGPIKEILNMT